MEGPIGSQCLSWIYLVPYMPSVRSVYHIYGMWQFASKHDYERRSTEEYPADGSSPQRVTGLELVSRCRTSCQVYFCDARWHGGPERERQPVPHRDLDVRIFLFMPDCKTKMCMCSQLLRMLFSMQRRVEE